MLSVTICRPSLVHYEEGIDAIDGCQRWLLLGLNAVREQKSTNIGGHHGAVDDDCSSSTINRRTYFYLAPGSLLLYDVHEGCDTKEWVCVMFYPLLITYMLLHDGKPERKSFGNLAIVIKVSKMVTYAKAHSKETVGNGIYRDCAKFHGCWPSGRFLFDHPHGDRHFDCFLLESWKSKPWLPTMVDLPSADASISTNTSLVALFLCWCDEILLLYGR
jgi:hypothetical protein